LVVYVPSSTTFSAVYVDGVSGDYLADLLARDFLWDFLLDFTYD
jgi:hypothetical protein